MSKKKEQYVEGLLQGQPDPELLGSLTREELQEVATAHELLPAARPDRKFSQELKSQMIQRHQALYAREGKEKAPGKGLFRMLAPAAAMVAVIALVGVGFLEMGERRLARQEAETFVPKTRLAQEDAAPPAAPVAPVPAAPATLEEDLLELEGLIQETEFQLAFLSEDLGAYEESVRETFMDFETDL